MADPRAYMRELPRCPCGKVATVEVFNSRNASFGKFCGPCGKRTLTRVRSGS